MKIINDIDEYILQLAIGLSKKNQEEQKNFFHYINEILACEDDLFKAQKLDISEETLIKKISMQVKETLSSEKDTLAKELKTVKELLYLQIKLQKEANDKINEYLDSVILINKN